MNTVAHSCLHKPNKQGTLIPSRFCLPRSTTVGAQRGPFEITGHHSEAPSVTAGKPVSRQSGAHRYADRGVPAETFIGAICMRCPVLRSRGSTGPPDLLHFPPRFPNSISTKHSSNSFPELNNKLLCHFPVSVVLTGRGERHTRPLTSGPSLSTGALEPGAPHHPGHTSTQGRNIYEAPAMCCCLLLKPPFQKC